MHPPLMYLHQNGYAVSSAGEEEWIGLDVLEEKWDLNPFVPP